MYTYPEDPDLFLFDVTDIESADPDPRLPPEIHEYLRTAAGVLQWARSYLTEPHSELGRKGAVCPYVNSSIKSALFYST